MAALDVLGTIDNVRAMVTGLTAWQEICKVDNATDAGKHVHDGGVETDREDDAEESIDYSHAPCMILDVDPIRTEWTQSTSRGDIVIEMRTEVAIPDDCPTYRDQYRFAWLHLGRLLSGINAAVGGSDQLMIEAVDVPLKPGPIDPDQNNGRIDWMFTISLSIRWL